MTIYQKKERLKASSTTKHCAHNVRRHAVLRRVGALTSYLMAPAACAGASSPPLSAPLARSDVPKFVYSRCCGCRAAGATW
eukprot:6179961-Pleurochrysis_carterae.AAC.1